MSEKISKQSTNSPKNKNAKKRYIPIDSFFFLSSFGLILSCDNLNLRATNHANGSKTTDTSIKYISMKIMNEQYWILMNNSFAYTS